MKPLGFIFGSPKGVLGGRTQGFKVIPGTDLHTASYLLLVTTVDRDGLEGLPAPSASLAPRRGFSHEASMVRPDLNSTSRVWSGS